MTAVDCLEKVVPSRKARTMLEWPASTLDWYVKNEVVKPTDPGEGRGTSRVFTLQEIWALGIARAVREAGFGLDAATEAATILLGYSRDDLHEAFAAGRRCLLVFQWQEMIDIVPLLSTPESIMDNKELKRFQKAGKKAGMGLRWWGIDVMPMLVQIVERYKKATDQKRPPKKSRKGATRKK